jgi:integrase
MGKRQFGGIQQRASGRWQARYSVDGTWRYAPETFETKAKAGAWLASIQTDQGRGVWTDPNGGQKTLSEYVTAWLERKQKVGHYRPRTLELVTWQLDKVIVPALGKKRLVEIKTPMIRNWLADVAAARTLGQASKCYRLLRTILGEATADGAIPFNPCTIKGAGTEHPAERPMPTVEAIADIVEQLNPRYSALVWTAALSGLREGELFALERRDVDLLHKTINVNKQAQNVGKERVVGLPKSAAGVREVAISSNLANELDEHLSTYTGTSPTDHVFTSDTGLPLHRVRFGYVWRRAARAAGHDGLHFHDLRHYAGTLAAQHGATSRELMERLGHSTARASLIYQHSTAERQREVADRMDAVIVPLRRGAAGTPR